MSQTVQGLPDDAFVGVATRLLYGELSLPPDETVEPIFFSIGRAEALYDVDVVDVILDL